MRAGRSNMRGSDRFPSSLIAESIPAATPPPLRHLNSLPLPPPYSRSPSMDGAALISAVIFDLDGTLLDTERATDGILNEFLARYGKSVDPAKEEKRLGKMHKEAAAAIVQDYRLPMTAEEYSRAIMPLYQERWPLAKALPGVNRLIGHLRKHGIPLALASNSIRKHIELKISHHQGWAQSFSVILGGDDVNHGKPFPDIYLEAAKRLGVNTSNCLVIEDSPVGVKAAKTAGAKVVAVPSLQGQDDCYSIANYMLHSLLEFQPESWDLPAFDDWVQNALPIELLFVRGLDGELVSQDGVTQVNVTADTGSYELVPDQVCGVFFGWAKLELHGMYKVIVNMGWDTLCGVSKRVTIPHLIGHVDGATNDRLDLFLTGYIRKTHSWGSNKSKGLKVSEEDLEIGGTALDLPLFSPSQLWHHSFNL